jgi:hypothetical protein
VAAAGVTIHAVNKINTTLKNSSNTKNKTKQKENSKNNGCGKK